VAPIFQNEFQQKWNAWLKTKYADDAALTAAWGKVDAGESLDRGTVKLRAGPVQTHGLSSCAGKRLRSIAIRSTIISIRTPRLLPHAGPRRRGVNVAPFSFDTQYRPHMAWNFTSTWAR